MVNIKAIVAGSLVVLSGTTALSTTCTAQVASLALGDAGSCLALTSLLPVLSASGSIIDSVNSYLSNLCATSTPTCTNSTLTSAESSVQSGCSSDISGGGTNAAEVDALLSLLQFYPQVHTAGCAKNQTTNEYCLTSTLEQVQNGTGQNITSSFLTSLLAGTGSTDSITQFASTGQLCTGCVQTIYDQALSANSTIASSTIGQAITSQCPAFNSTSATGVSSVSTSAAAATSSAAQSTGAAGKVEPLKNVLPFAACAGVMMAAVAVGGSLVL
ncbi:hypothetical protein BCR39DRAFT_518065 [Naematelia encephala]|uniref:DUF7729 domain-containing protein n=1 Tax=Naematelia encephala TaxID=71784 RepID=A0A1Y2BIT1_9TREE|nr:hypothetical protein BCR39DRAFT_518065 [Naematelia encephala]